MSPRTAVAAQENPVRADIQTDLIVRFLITILTKYRIADDRDIVKNRHFLRGS